MDERQLETLIDEHGDYILRLCYTYLKDWQIAEELTQDTFFRFYKSSNRFRRTSSDRTYLYRIAVNRCKSYLVTWRYKQLFFGKLTHRIEHTNYVEQQMIEQNNRRTLYEKIDQLPIKYREVLLLFHYMDLTTKEISSVLNMSENTVKTRLRRARMQLGEMLKEEGIQDGQNS